MKKMTGFIVAMMLLFSSPAFAGGDQNCGDNGQCSTGVDGQGTATQNRAPNPD